MKAILSITLAAIVLAFSGSLYSQENKSTAKQNQSNGVYFIDKNNDGICDNFTGYGKGNGKGAGRNGKCDGTGNPNGKNFIDENKDGKCDRFVDSNNDGKCDNRGKNCPNPNGGGQGRRQHGRK